MGATVDVRVDVLATGVEVAVEPPGVCGGATVEVATAVVVDVDVGQGLFGVRLTSLVSREGLLP